MAVTKRTRYEVLRRDNHTCRYCGGRAPDVVITVDHVVPVALGGSDDPSNLVAACKDCNAGKAASTPDGTLVAQVAEDAVRWAAAMRTAVDQELTAYGQREAYRERFIAAWKAMDPKLSLLASGWFSSLTRWQEIGVPIELVLEALDIAWGHSRVSNANVFRYMAGIVWRKAQDLAEAAAPTQSTDGGRCGHCPTCLRPDWFEPGTRCLLLTEQGDDYGLPQCQVCGSDRCLYAIGQENGSIDGWRTGHESGLTAGRSAGQYWFDNALERFGLPKGALPNYVPQLQVF